MMRQMRAPLTHAPYNQAIVHRRRQFLPLSVGLRDVLGGFRTMDHGVSRQLSRSTLFRELEFCQLDLSELDE